MKLIPRKLDPRTGLPKLIDHPLIKIGNKRSGSKYKAKSDETIFSIDRPSESVLGNYVGAKYGDRVSAIQAYELWFIRQMRNKKSEVYHQVNEILQVMLQGKKVRLMCWCWPKDCHGVIIANYLIDLYNMEMAKSNN